MKKLFSTVVITMFLLVAFTGAAFAAQGGMPDVHGVDGPTFGGAVRELAQDDPIALAEHVSGGGGGECGGGMPADHGLSGQEFGWVVSGLAQEDPGALADHVSAYAQGKPAAHGLSGYAFGQAVRSFAPISDHVRR